MSFRDRIIRIAVALFLEGPGRRRGFERLERDLRDQGDRFRARLDTAAGDDAEREKLRHIVGIERWGQRRLRVGLGAPYVEDDYHPYRPPKTTDWDQLKTDFRDTRAATLALVERLRAARAKGELPRDLRVPHNQLGELSLQGWLRYLQIHTWSEGRRIG